MKQFILFAFSAIMLSTSSFAQKGDLIAKRSDKGLYLEHKVVSKESFFAIGRMYNINAKFLATYNKLDINKGLKIDQKLRIPLTDSNFVQQGNKGTPIFYKVGDKEGLMTVSQKNNNVLLSNLRWWNNLTSDELNADKKLIVGFIQSAVMPSIIIAGQPVKEELIFHTEEKIEENEPIKEEKKPIVKEEVKKTDTLIKKEEVKTLSIDQGYFKNHFEQQVKINPATKTETVTGGIFKTMSGWQDAKYYLLIDKVSPGTIVRVINPTNNKAVYAKVLGEMSGIRQNEGLNVRISNAAASALGIAEVDKFIVKVNY
jgi:LysM repeat protein